MTRERYWTISNGLSASRILLAVPIALLISSADMSLRWWAFGLTVVAVSTDFFDGRLARRLNQVTEFGRIVDPLADKLAILLIGGVLTLHGRIPVWFLVALASRDLAIVWGGLHIKKMRGVTLQSNQAGKWAVTSVALYILCTVIDVPQIAVLKTALLAISTIMLVISFTLYAKRFLAVLHAKQAIFPETANRMEGMTKSGSGI